MNTEHRTQNTLISLLKKINHIFHLDLTKNLKYDRLTHTILKRKLSLTSNCIDVGCHKGEILNLMMKYAPSGTHFAFEPIPYLFQNLKKAFGESVNLYPYAIAERQGETTFRHVKNAPAYSGILQRKYDIPNPDIEEIQVEMKTLDEIIPENIHIDLIKIDVEGGEFGVLKGAERILLRDHPVIIFECGLGASDYYGTKPGDLFVFFTTKCGMNIYSLQSYLRNSKPFSISDFEACFQSNTEYYFVAN